MSAEQWEVLTVKARSAGMNVSQLIRYALLDDDAAQHETAPPRPMTQADRDAILRRVNKGS